MTINLERIQVLDQPTAFCVADPTTNPTRPMTHFLTLDTRDGVVDIVEAYSTDGYPLAARAGHVRRYAIPHTTDAAALTTAVKDGEFTRLLERVRSGAELVWDGNNYVTRVTDHVTTAEMKIREKIREHDMDTEFGGLWDAWDWVQGIDPADLGITADSTDEQLEAVAQELEAEAQAHGAVLYHTRQMLEAVRAGE